MNSAPRSPLNMRPRPGQNIGGKATVGCDCSIWRSHRRCVCHRKLLGILPLICIASVCAFCSISRLQAGEDPPKKTPDSAKPQFTIRDIFGSWVFDLDCFDEFFDAVIAMQAQMGAPKPSAKELERRKNQARRVFKENPQEATTYSFNEGQAPDEIVLAMSRADGFKEVRALETKGPNNSDRSFEFTEIGNSVRKTTVSVLDRNHIKCLIGDNKYSVAMPLVRKQKSSN
jgi:hypothetical protein